MVRNNNQLPTNLLQLQNCIKRDSESYKEEFQLQYKHFKALLDVVKLNPSSPDKQFEELSMFMAQVSSSYKEELKELPNDFMDILKMYSTVLHPDVRLALVKALILMRNRGLLTETDLLSLFFELLRCQDKELRKFLKNHLISDIKNINAKHKDVRVNTTLQNFMYSIINDGGAVAAKMSLDIMTELYNKHVWRDVKTVNVIADACFSKVTKLMVTAIKFFLGADEEEAEEKDSSSEDEGRLESIQHSKKAKKNQKLSNCVNSKSRKRQKLMRKIEKKMKKKESKSSTAHFDFSALHLIYDPQGMAEKLLKNVEAMNERFEVKMMVMNLISRLIGVHDLFLFNYYPLLQRYLRPHQTDVTKILVFAAQSSHELVPPDILEPLVKTIAENFISERNSAECITVGINSVREICSRCPLVMKEDLLQDLAMYQKYKDKNVSMAARSLVQLFRVTNPGLLKRKDRGRPTEASVELEPKSYGESRAPSYVPGAEILASKEDDGDEDDDEWEDEEEDDRIAENDGWESCSDEEEGSKDDDEWSAVSSEDEEEEEAQEVEDSMSKTKSRDEERGELKRERAEEAELISSTRILTDEDFKMIKKAKLKKQFEAVHPRQRKMKADEEEESEDESGDEEMTDLTAKKELVSIRDIERLYKKPKENKESRLATVIAGREGREKFGQRKEKMNPHSSTKEKEKKKNKAFSMIKHKVRGKKKRSFQDKQRDLKSRLIKQLKHSHR